MGMQDLLFGILMFSIILIGLGSVLYIVTDEFEITATHNLSTMSQIEESQGQIENISSKLYSGDAQDVTVLNTIGILATSAFEAVKLYASVPSIIQNIGTDINIVTGGVIPGEVFIVIGGCISLIFIAALFKVFTKVDKV